MTNVLLKNMSNFQLAQLYYKMNIHPEDQMQRVMIVAEMKRRIEAKK